MDRLPDTRTLLNEAKMFLNEYQDIFSKYKKDYKDEIDIKNRKDMELLSLWVDQLVDQNYSEEQLSTQQVGDMWSGLEKAIKRKRVETYADAMEWIFDHAGDYGRV
jgi:hypothetical protein